MTETECLEIAEQYLAAHGIQYLPPGRVGSKNGDRWEAIFLLPETADPAVATVDPPDVRIWVTVAHRRAELIHQM